MEKKAGLPDSKRRFTLKELEDMGLTRLQIDKLVQEGTLIKLGDSTYAHIDYDGLNENTTPDNNCFALFGPARVGLDVRGMDRSLVHYAAPERMDSLQLVCLGVQTTLLYGFGPAIQEFTDIHFLFAGKGYATVGKQHFEVSAGQIMHLPRGVKYYFEYDEEDPPQYLWVAFCGEWEKKLLNEIGLNETNLVADIADLQAVKDLAERSVRQIAEDSSYVAMMPCFWQCIQLLKGVRGYPPLKKKSKNKKNRAPAAERKIEDGRIIQIVNYIEREYGRNIVVNDLADNMEVSRAWLSRKFKEYTGKTIKEYVTDVRISHAKDFLTRTTWSVAEIAEKCGYQNQMFFSRMFKQAAGVSPTQWRNGER